ncbi:MAG: circadian clock protein KaiC [Desulfobacteraceae bacterium]|nr:circadian clock protein KaiC [Desulfobacteraceae bacterium]
MAEKPAADQEPSLPQLPKSPTGISGFDQITEGGVPRGRPTLVCGGPGSGKTLFSMEFLVKGAVEYGEPGVFVAFEERPEELTKNVASLGFDLADLAARKKLLLDHVHIERSELEVTGEYDLEGFFVRLGYLIDSIGAKRIVIDTLEALFASLPNEAILRAELRRLFRWLKGRGMTAMITAERGLDEATLTRHGLEEYVSDCVILLDHRVSGQISTRRLRIVKYRGSYHGTNEYPFLIERQGISILPISAVELRHHVSTDRVSSGISRLDTMLAGGYYRGSSILISGTAGSGKSSFASSFAAAACRSGERCLYFAFEESEPQIKRNMAAIGLDLGAWTGQGLLRFEAARPTVYGLEMHLVRMHAAIEAFQPAAVVMDPISNMTAMGNPREVNAMLSRLIDFLKEKGITSVFTTLAHPESTEETEVAISSLIDTWLLLRTVEMSGERNRTLFILKSRGMAHSNQVREFLITDRGIELTNVYIGEGLVFTGSAREAQEAKDRAEALARRQEIEQRRRAHERQRRLIESQIATLQTQLDQEEEDLKMALAQMELRDKARSVSNRRQEELRRADAVDERAGSTGRGRGKEKHHG